MQPTNLKAWLEYASHDHDSLVKAVVLRLLIENGFEDYLDSLLEMAASPTSYEDRWAACKALRRQSGNRTFREAVEARLTPVLENRLSDKLELVDIRFQAARALGDLQHKWLDAVKALTRLLEDDIPDWVRRTCVAP
jgi:HEAT repeat protein